MKKYFCFLLFIGIVWTACSDKEDFQSIENQVENPTAREIRRELLGSFVLTRSAGYDYPDYFGGMYYANDSKLAVLVKSGNESEVPNFLVNNSNVILESCKYSLNELNNVMKIIDDYMVNASVINPIAENVRLWGVSQQNNCVEVLMYTCTQNTIEEFRRVVIDSPVLSFKSCNQANYDWNKININLVKFMARAVVNAYPGMPITAAAPGATKGNPGSFGYKAKKGNTIGFVTAGHVAALNNIISRNLSTQQNEMGVCKDSRHVNGGNIDAAFCTLTSSSFQLVNYITNNSAMTLTPTIYRDVEEGTSAYLAGSVIASSGKVVKVGVSVRDKNTGVTIKGLVQVDYISYSGDSGGLVYTRADNKYQVLGIHQSGDGDDIDIVAAYCPATTIESVMGVVPCD